MVLCHRHCHDSVSTLHSTVVIPVIIMMLKQYFQSLLCTIVNPMNVRGLMECIASDYAESHSRKWDMQTGIG